MTVQTPLQLVITIGIIALGTFSDPRPSSFFLFPAGKETPRVVYLPRRQCSPALPSQCSSFTVLKMSLYFPVLMGCRSSSVPCSSLSSTNGGTTCCSPSSAARFYTCCWCSGFFLFKNCILFCRRRSAIFQAFLSPSSPAALLPGAAVMPSGMLLLTLPSDSRSEIPVLPIQKTASRFLQALPSTVGSCSSQYAL